ncbi:hypothetical protein AVEN_154133-1 [Araneus ventricosus]|uniref:Uncharacterized protein n=1 Tax=Araneus ventricosus TaxID=182803 RepID=A0A4Y2MUB6_ARAVE|nr:hypothetical protein AVEN_154133-1 [Araneus ventricosus]
MSKFRKPMLSGSATWILISSVPVSIDWCTDGTNASTTMAMWKNNMYHCLSTFVCLFDLVNKPFISEDLLPYFLNHPCGCRMDLVITKSRKLLNRK